MRPEPKRRKGFAAGSESVQKGILLSHGLGRLLVGGRRGQMADGIRMVNLSKTKGRPIRRPSLLSVPVACSPF